jgi:hypothetical protein
MFVPNIVKMYIKTLGLNVFKGFYTCVDFQIFGKIKVIMLMLNGYLSQLRPIYSKVVF